MIALGPLFEFGSKLIDKLISNPQEKAKAQLDLLRMQQTGELDLLKVEMSAILAEAQSSDPWTSRARPTFLYMCYILILCGIPMGVISAFSPATATNIANGFGAWLNAIPEQIITLMGVGYLGYTGARTLDKWKSK